MGATNLDERRRNARRNAFWLAAVAAMFYLGFIAMSIMRGL
jgi:hypothetical protein